MRPARPRSLKQARHSPTVETETPSSSVSATLAIPSAARRMILAHSAVRCSVVPAQATRDLGLVSPDYVYECHRPGT